MAERGPITSSSQWELHAHDGPPCTSTTSGYVLPGTSSLGNISQPCTRVVPFIQCTLRISPHAALTPAFRLVSRFQLPIGPTQTSGGALPDWRTTAVIDPSREKAASGTHASLVVPSSSSPVP